MRINLFKKERALSYLFYKTQSDDEENIFSKVKIHRTPSTILFEFLVGITVIAIWLANIRNIIHGSSEDTNYYITLMVSGSLLSLGALWRSYHPTKANTPMKITNSIQVRQIAQSGRITSFLVALLFLWLSCEAFIKEKDTVIYGAIAIGFLFLLNIAILLYKIYKTRKWVEIQPTSYVTNETLLCIVTVVGISVIHFTLRSLGMNAFLSAFTSIILIGLILWVCNKYLGLFKEINNKNKLK